ncbi:MAG: DUF1573 domain-containing protein [Bacteroidetes bacterium]|jgi:hypothetical protein|nr:DUF1573 domain-containing protein [Bacteroidota bacterium]
MNKWALVFFLALAASGPKMHFDNRKHNFGQQQRYADVEHKFLFSNHGDAPLVIKSHETSCHCTSAHYGMEPVMPGENGWVTVRYDATKVGVFYRKVTLHTNAGTVVLAIKGEILADHSKVDPVTGD